LAVSFKKLISIETFMSLIQDDVLSILYQGPLTKKSLQGLEIAPGTLDKLIAQELVRDIDKTGIEGVYQITKSGQAYVEKRADELARSKPYAPATA